MYILYTDRRPFTRRTVKKYQCLLCAFHWNTEQILHYLSNRFTSKKKKDIYTLIYLLGKASYNRNNSRNNTDEHRWDIATPETNAALSKGQYFTEGRVLTRNEFKRTNKSFVVQLSWIVNIPHGNPQSLLRARWSFNLMSVFLENSVLFTKQTSSHNYCLFIAANHVHS